jgi:stearoyl-CoA desaturase (delta-9 desaturase)
MNIPDSPSRNAQINYIAAIPFFLVHLIGIYGLFLDSTWFEWKICLALYFIRMFFITAGYHRYFSHRTYKTSRWFQFLIAFMAQTSAQKGVLWWACHHRDHHRHSDKPEDPHSMKLYGFLYSHIGWILTKEFDETNFKKVKDLASFPELVFLNKYHLIPPILLGAVVFFLGGFHYQSLGMPFLNGALTTLVIGFFLSTVILYHGTFLINSLMHKIGKIRYKTEDESRNSLLLALITLGEGWHNNHHYYQGSTRQGFYWWEIDISFYILKILETLGLVWDLRGVPQSIRDGNKAHGAR